MELCSTGTQCTIDPQFYCSRCQEGSGRVRRGFLSQSPNLDDFFSQSRHCQCVLFCQRSAVNYDIQMSYKLSFHFLPPSITWLTDTEIYEICLQVLSPQKPPESGLSLAVGHFSGLVPSMHLFQPVPCFPERSVGQSSSASLYGLRSFFGRIKPEKPHMGIK